MNPTQQPNSRFTAVNPSSNGIRWEPQKQQGLVIDPNNPPALEGYFTSFDPRSGPNGNFMSSTITTINPDGSIGDDYDVAGGVGLENSMRDIPLNMYVRIEFHGKKINPKNGRTYNDFKVFKDEQATRYDQRPDVIAAGGVHMPPPATPQRQAPAPAAQHPLHNQQQQPGLQQNNQFLHQGQQQQWQQPAPQTNIHTPPPNYQTPPPVNPQQNFQAPPVFNQPPTVQTFTPQPPAPQQSTQQAPPIQQRSFTPPPASQNPQPTFQAPPQNPQNGIFGGQPVNDPFGNGDLPF